MKMCSCMLCVFVLLMMLPVSHGGEKNKKKKKEEGSPISVTTILKGVELSWKVYVPPDYDKNYQWPLVINTCTSRTGHVEHDAWPMFQKAGYFMGIAQKIPKKFEMDKYIAHILELKKNISKDYSLDKERVFTLGFSVHGSYAMMIALQRPEVFRGAISVCHIYPSPTSATQIRKSLNFLVISGPKDYNYPALKQAWKIYQSRGHRIAFLDIEDLSHLYRKSEVPQQLKWLDQFGPGKKLLLKMEKARKKISEEKYKDAQKILQEIMKCKTAHPVIIEAKKENEKISNMHAKEEKEKLPEGYNPPAND